MNDGTSAAGDTVEGRTDLLVVIDAFVTGGVASLYSAIVGAAADRDLSVTVVGRAGLTAARLPWGRARVVQLDDWDSDAARQLAVEVDRADRVVWQASPITLRCLMAAMPHRGLAVSIHSSAGVTNGWFGPSLMPVLSSLLSARPHLTTLAPSRPVADGLAELVGLPRERFTTLTHVTDRREGGGGHRPEERVVVATRLSPEKRFTITAGAVLARARQVPLVVVGEGDDVEWLTDLGTDVGVDVRLVRDPDIHRHVATDDVVVAVGLVALEMVQICGAVVTTSLHGALADTVRADNARDLHELNFLLGPDHVGLDPHEVWRQVDSLTHEDRRRVRTTVARASDPDRALQEVLDACDADQPSRDVDDGVAAYDATAGAFRVTAAAWLHEREADREWIAELTRSRDWLTTHRAELKAWCDQLEEARDHHHRRSEHLAALLRDLGHPGDA